MKQWIHASEAGGLVVDSVYYQYDWLIIVFKQDAYTSFHADCSYGEVEINCDKIEVTEMGRCLAVERGIMTADEYDAIQAEKESEWRAQLKKQRREQYERLKAEFEGE